MKKKISILSMLLIIIGLVFILGGIGGTIFTYKNVARENITTPDDASIPEAAVRGPFTLRAQADIIRHHMLNTSEGLTYAEMPRQIPSLDGGGNPLLDNNGEPIMVANAARSTWVTATTLITALNLAIMAYALFAMMILIGIISLFAGKSIWLLNKRQ